MTSAGPVCASYPAYAKNYGTRHGGAVKQLVIHTMEASLPWTSRWFAKPQAGVSAHYGIDAGGELVRFVDESYAAWHSGNQQVNWNSIGIELEGKCADPHIFTPLMLKTLVELCDWLTSKYSIPVDREHIIGHNEVPDPGDPHRFGGTKHHTDPGPFFPWDGFIGALARLKETP